MTSGDRVALAALSLGAAAVHFAMVPGHAGESRAEGIGFALAAWLGVAFAVAVVRRPTARVLAAGVVLHLALVGAWAVSRTAGLPGQAAEEVGRVDLFAVGLEVGVVVLASLALLGAVRLPAAAGAVAAAAVLGLTTVAVTSPSATGHHGETAEVALPSGAVAVADDGHAHAHGAVPAEEEPAAVAVAPASSSDALGHEDHLPTSTEPPTSAQLLRAADLVSRTTAAITPRYDDIEAARAAGFIPLQGAEARFVHWVHLGWMGNENVLDPNEPESLVYRNTPDGQVLEAAMYILPRKGMAIPDVGGSLTAWHNHGDLCFRTSDARIVGTTASGPCPAGSRNVPTSDMLHVWVVDHPGGPFAGIE